MKRRFRGDKYTLRVLCPTVEKKPGLERLKEEGERHDYLTEPSRG